eukprot:NODE_84_length_2418_cov_164.959843_g63_i0.p1 GENE.NODE_84_length_2418_cov_164.959843_g63_i0~~NODE_84_length_2418_cov_164.959843_g63_i0.p1  ORF type:complete len:764 (-),score=196.90 NODE_84_length_2418_cov_164.959843_g63_i0:126-2360(-)
MRQTGALFLLLAATAYAVAGFPVNQTVHSAKYSAEIHWDEWNVPHIYGDDDVSVAYAFGYAHGRDHGVLMMRQVMVSSGRMSEFNGRIWEFMDANTWASRLPKFAEEFYELQVEESTAKFEAFAQGFSQYAEEFPDSFQDVQELLPLTGLDIFRANLRIIYTFCLSGSESFDFLEEAKSDGMQEHLEKDNVYWASYHKLDLFAGLGLSDDLREVIGSNAWALNKNSGRTDGSTSVTSNPHLPYFFYFSWYEAHLVTPEQDIYGATLVGIPGLQIAFTKYLSWTHTVNPVQNTVAYEVELADFDHYILDGEVHPIQREEFTFKVKQLIGYKEVTVVVESTTHGQIFKRSEDKILVKKIGGVNENPPRVNALAQWAQMSKAQNLEEFKSALAMNQIPIFYTVVGTHEGDIMNSFNGWVPDREHMDIDKSWDAAQVPLPGGNSSLIWETCLEWEQLPRVENPEVGYVSNANEPIWSTSLPFDEFINEDDYSGYICPPSRMSYRAQVASRLMYENSNITFERLIELKHSTLYEAAAHALDDLLVAVAEHGNGDPKLEQAAAILKDWDRHTDTTSVGAVLFHNFIRAAPGQSDLYLNQWEKQDPLATPNTLANPAEAVENLRTAINRLEALDQPLDAAWGDVNKFFAGKYMDFNNTVPSNGCGECFRNTYHIPNVALGGDTFVCVVAYKDDDMKAKCLLGYGNTSIGSDSDEHLNDQAQLYSDKELRDVHLPYEDVVAHAEKTVVFRQA